MSILAYYRASHLLKNIAQIGPTYDAATPDKYVNFRVAPEYTAPKPIGSGRYRDVLNSATWDIAIAAAQPGDVIRIRANIPRNLTARGNKYGIGGANMSEGTDGAPIVITCDPSVWINPNDTSNNVGALDIINIDHVHAVGVNVKNSQFGIRCMNVEGSASNPVRVAYCTVEDIGHAGIAMQGWWTTITGSGGTPSAGSGNEYGFSRHLLCEANNVTRTGRTDTEYGEGIYFGRGSTPGWVSFCDNFVARYNNISHFTSDGIDVKPGCTQFKVHDNVVRSGQAHFGAPLSLCYVASGIDSLPGWMPADIEGYVEGNRVFDLNLSETGGTTSNQLCYFGMSGLRLANNIFWAYPDSTTPFYAAVVARIEKDAADFGTATSWLYNNLYWGRGFENRGYGASPTPLTLGAWFTDLNNIYSSGYSGGQHTATSSDFDYTVAAVGENDSADDNGWGFGANFDLANASGLQGAGTAFTSSNLFIDADISQRSIPGVTPNPGPFQAY